jgi:hypothetical protein
LLLWRASILGASDRLGEQRLTPLELIAHDPGEIPNGLDDDLEVGPSDQLAMWR